MLRNAIQKVIVGISVVSAAMPSICRGEDVVASSNEVAVPYGDLDLTQPKNQAILNNRVKRAVVEVCGLEGKWLSDHQRVRSCRETSLQLAQTQIAGAIRRAELNGSVTISANEARAGLQTALIIGQTAH